MNELSYGQPAQQPMGEFGPQPASYPAVAAEAQELAQLILTGMQRDIETQIDWRLQQQKSSRKDVAGNELGLILGSIGIGVPLTAIAGAMAGLAGIVVIWVGLVLINAAWASRR